jgi:hypothetical protein
MRVECAMPHDAFISHSVKDQEVSDCIYSHLEAKGIKCFMDTRDLIPGKSYPTQLTDAIKGSRVVVLVFSSNSDTSDAVQAELGIARNDKIPIVPVRIENLFPHGLALFIYTSQWLDAFPPPIETHLSKLVSTIGKHLDANPLDQRSLPPAAVVYSQPSELGAVIADREWHDVDYGHLADWARKRSKALDSGKIIVGKTFLYRRDRDSGKYQRRLRELP